MLNMKKSALVFSLAVASMGAAQAALIGAAGFKPLESVSFDTKLNVAALVYDHNFYSATEGRLVMLAGSSTLSGAGVPTGGAQPGQSYLGGGDTLRDLVLSVKINNATGAFISGSVAIPLSNDAGPNDSWTFSGTLTNFGYNNSQLDASWDVDAYDFSDVAADPTLIAPGISRKCSKPSGSGLCGWDAPGDVRQGGLVIIADPALPQASGAINFGVDWVITLGATSAAAGVVPQLGSFASGLTTASYVSKTVQADIWMTPVPEPKHYALLAAGLLTLGLAKRRSNRG